MTEIRSFLLRFAKNAGYRVQEFKSDEKEAAFFCHIEVPAKDDTPRQTATAVARESADNAMVMAFLQLGDFRMDFLEDEG